MNPPLGSEPWAQQVYCVWEVSVGVPQRDTLPAVVLETPLVCLLLWKLCPVIGTSPREGLHTSLSNCSSLSHGQHSLSRSTLSSWVFP